MKDNFFYKLFHKKPDIGKRVFVGVSGGVDSSVSLALLQEQGYDVTGVFIRTWTPDWLPCTWRDERRDAMRVCAHLSVPFVELNLENEYKQGVADYMIAEYTAGRTPNPDVMCNKTVKFGGFMNWAIEQGADYIATGHYARTYNGQLYQGVDSSKDQSYFLWTLTTEQLKHTLFPIGHLEKTEVRDLAKKYKLPTAIKKDSQGICFIGEVDMKEFLKHYIQTSPGDVQNEHGVVIGVHDGALLYTLGERHGFIIADKHPDDKPYYVIAKDVIRNTITVSQNPNILPLHKQSAYVLDQVYLRNEVFLENKEYAYTAQIRYHGEQKKCVLHQKNGQYSITFTETDYTIASGQSVVLYNKEICLGGGIIK